MLSKWVHVVDKIARTHKLDDSVILRLPIIQDAATTRILFTLRQPSIEPSVEPSVEPYQYQNLSGPRSFRVLRLFRPGADYSLIHEELKEASIDDTPEYEALSYTWGEPTLSERITIDGHALSITANCASALHHLLRGKFSRIVWVDSVCINQSFVPSALQERSQQVQMMGEIYQRASRVIVHLGDGDEASDVAVKNLECTGVAYLAAIAPGPMHDWRRTKYEKLKVDALTSSEQFPYGKLYGLFKRPWFERTWVIQEIAVAKEVLIYCGNHLLRLETLAAGANFTKLPTSRIIPSDIHWRSYFGVYHLLREAIRRKSEGEDLLSPNLQGILYSASLKKATKPEDKVYALYGICKFLGFELPEPDYRKPLNVVYTETTRCILECDKSLEFLSFTEGTGLSKGLPSWVLDLTDRFEPEGPKMAFGPLKPFRAAGSSEYAFGLLPDGQRLQVLGRRFDRLSSRGTTFAVDYGTTMIGGAPRKTGEIWGSLGDAIQGWMQIAQQLSNYPTGEPITNVFARTVLRNEFLGKLVSPDMLDRIVRCLSFIVKIRGGLIPFSEFELWRNNPETQVLLEALAKDTTWKTLFHTDRLYMGTAPYNAQNGDMIAIFYGCRVPFIVRPCPGGHQLIGPAYVHGIMNGEFWDAGSPSDDEWFILV